jgi:hypothetical protein
VSIGFGRIPNLIACGPTGGGGAIVALELVRTFEDLATLFGSYPCSARLQTAQVSALWLDMLAFIPAYAAFLALGARALGEELEGLTLVAVLTMIAAAVLDEIEGVILLDLIADLSSPPDNFGALFWTVRPKFALLGLAELMIAVLLVRGTWLARIAAVPVAGGAMLSLYLLFANPRAPLMMEGHRYAWTALLIVALLASVRPALVARPEPV